MSKKRACSGFIQHFWVILLVGLWSHVMHLSLKFLSNMQYKPNSVRCKVYLLQFHSFSTLNNSLHLTRYEYFLEKGRVLFTGRVKVASEMLYETIAVSLFSCLMMPICRFFTHHSCVILYITYLASFSMNFWVINGRLTVYVKHGKNPEILITKKSVKLTSNSMSNSYFKRLWTYQHLPNHL